MGKSFDSFDEGLKQPKKLMLREKEFYGKLCVASGLFFVVGEERVEDFNPIVDDKFSCNIATILARDKEVVAVRLIVLAEKSIILISKNGIWSEEDNNYMRKIERYLKNIAEHPFQGKSLENRDVQAFYRDVMVYCFSKLQTRFEKLKRDITQNPQNEYVSQFVKFASIDVNNIDNVNLFKLSLSCYRFYQSIKAKPNTPKIFLEHLKKVASYHESFKDIVNCARNDEYKKLFSNVRLRKLDPTLGDKHIYSWSNIIKRFIPDPIKYKDFKKTCLKDPLIANRLRSIYGVINNEILLDFEVVKLSVCLHAEMNIVADIIERNNKRTTFIAVSKRCCYLCELYIKFANDNGYNIIIPGSHKKIYHSWKLPNIKGNSDFNEKALSYLIGKLDQVIKDETNRHRVFTKRSDSRERSREGDSESDNPDDDFMSFYSLNYPNF